MVVFEEKKESGCLKGLRQRRYSGAVIWHNSCSWTKCTRMLEQPVLLFPPIPFDRPSGEMWPQKPPPHPLPISFLIIAIKRDSLLCFFVRLSGISSHNGGDMHFLQKLELTDSPLQTRQPIQGKLHGWLLAFDVELKPPFLNSPVFYTRVVTSPYVKCPAQASTANP